MDTIRKMVEEHLPSLLRGDGLRNNDLMVWLGVIQILPVVEAVVVVAYRDIRACLEEVDQTILGGNGKCSKITSLEFQYHITHSISLCKFVQPNLHKTAYFSSPRRNRIIWAGLNAIANT
jgi:hypothetical protein